MFKHLKGALCAATVLASVGAAAQADVVTEWNAQWLDTIRAVGGPPCPLARNQSMLFISMYEAINSIDRRNEPYLAYVPVERPASERAAVAAAAYKVLSELYPQRAVVYAPLYEEQIAAVRNVRARANGIAVGEAAAAAIIAARATDRTDIIPSYVYQDVPGAYRPTPPDFTSPPANPGWGATECWVMETGSQFRPTGPLGYARIGALLRSSGYARQFNEVKTLGARNSRQRTAEQTEIAWFWANDRDGTYKPPGQLMHMTEVVSRNEGLGLKENARLFALAALAMADAGAVAWDQKYSTDVDLWRPVSAVRLANTDSNSRTTKKANWFPLLDFSPPFPAYTSGHATFGGAHSAVMRNYFGTDNKTFTIGTDEPIVSNVTRTYTSFSQAARENGLSRIYLGVHFRCDADIGYATGTLLGNYVSRNMLRPIVCAADLNDDHAVTARDMVIFNTAFFGDDPVADFDGDGQVNELDYSLFVNSYLDGCEPIESSDNE